MPVRKLREEKFFELRFSLALAQDSNQKFG